MNAELASTSTIYQREDYTENEEYDDDDEFFEQMYQEYLANEDPEKGETISLEEYAAELGINLNEL